MDKEITNINGQTGGNIPDGLPIPSRYWAILAIGLGVTVSVLDGAIANVALPTIAGDLHTSPSASIWVVNAYQLAITISLLSLSSMGEIWGYRKVYTIGLLLFSCTSLACALSDSLFTLIIARTLQGFGAAAIASVNTALIRIIYPKRFLGRGMGINALVVSVSAAAGPTIAAGILSVGNWPWLFAINIPIGITALILSFKFLPQNPVKAVGRKFDVTAALMNALTFGLVIAIIEAFTHDVHISLIIAAIVIVLFWLSEIKKAYPSIQVVLFTAYADIDLAVRGIKEGATDFVVKPWDNAKLLETLQAAYQIRSANHKGGVGNKQLVSKESGMFWGDSNAMQQLRMLIEKVAKTDANILITGENGTGKEMLAREIHLLSPRKDEAMVPVDMGAITETLFESELFGHVKGAFTDARTDRPGKFEVANNGSLFLDEIGNLSYHLQAKLLTALQRRSIVRVGSNTPIPINIRLICATNRDLQEMVQKEQFREDLLYRINTIHVEIPPLRERPEDIVPLTEIFITKYTNIYGKKPMTLTDDAKEKLKAQPWLGNIRELEHTVEKAIIIADGDTLDGSNFDFPRKREAPVKNDITTLEEMEYTMIKAAMDKFGGNLSLVANQLGISRQTLYNKIKRYEL